MTAHTIGPWIVGTRVDGTPCVCPDRANGNNGNGGLQIATAFGPDASINARLIAAAPDMLAALRGALVALEFSVPSQAQYPEPLARHIAAESAIRAAIAKAEGEDV